MTNQYKQVLDAHQTMMGLASGAIDALEREVENRKKLSDFLKKEVSNQDRQSSRAADEAAIGEYEKQLKGVHEDLLATQASEAAAIKERDKLNDELERAHHAAGDRESALLEARKIIKNYEDRLKELDSATGDELARERKAVAELMDELATEKKAAKSLQSENSKLYSDLDKTRTEFGKFKQADKLKDQQLSKMIMENHDLKKLKNDLAAQLDAARLEAEEARTEVEALRSQPMPATNEKLEEIIHRAGEMIKKAIEEEDPEKLYRHLDRAMAKLHRPTPQGAAS